MQIRELSKPVTSKALNESLAKRFGYKINLEQFTDVQLEDARNKLRTKISQFEVKEGYTALHDSQDYQKTRLFLDCINQEILEREEGKEYVKSEGMEENTMKETELRKQIYTAKLKEKATEYSVPESWINSAIKKINLGESDAEELAAELTTRYDLSESVANHIVYLAEGEEDKAKVIMATKDMVDRVTGWLEDTAQMKAEQLLELLDSIRETMGSDVSQQYNDAVKPALEAIYQALETSRQGLSGAMAIVSGEEAPIMGTSSTNVAPGAPDQMGMDNTEPELATAVGREKRESVDYSRRLGILLNSKKK